MSGGCTLLATAFGSLESLVSCVERSEVEDDLDRDGLGNWFSRSDDRRGGRVSSLKVEEEVIWA